MGNVEDNEALLVQPVFDDRGSAALPGVAAAEGPGASMTHTDGGEVYGSLPSSPSLPTGPLLEHLHSCSTDSANNGGMAPLSLRSFDFDHVGPGQINPAPTHFATSESDGSVGRRGSWKKPVSFWPLVMLIFYSVSGGPFGIEPAVAAGGPLLTLLGFLLLPAVWSIPEALVTAELSTAFPEASGFVAWVRGDETFLLQLHGDDHGDGNGDGGVSAAASVFFRCLFSFSQENVIYSP
ncbi:unnamed protein product [Discosporangium mesarthrocarpum]